MTYSVFYIVPISHSVGRSYSSSAGPRNIPREAKTQPVHPVGLADSRGPRNSATLHLRMCMESYGRFRKGSQEVLSK